MGGKRKGNVEMYSSGQFFTMTGLLLPGARATIENREKELLSLYSRIFGEGEADPIRKDLGPAAQPDVPDDVLIAKALKAKDGEKFTKLWQGDWSGYPSQNEADQALVNILAFWTGKDEARIDRLFRRSGLIREKWDFGAAETYGHRTIRKAIEVVDNCYTPSGIDSIETYLTEPSETIRVKGLSEPVTEVAKPLNVNGIPAWPNDVMAGGAGFFARTYEKYQESPEPFHFISYLTCLGNVIGAQITLESSIKPQPRLFVPLLGESADDRKSTAIGNTSDHFADVIGSNELNFVRGVGSAEGLAKAFGKNNRVLLLLDEFKAMIQKMRIDGSVLLPCINTLFESNRFHSLTKGHDIRIDDAQLSILAASTLDTYRTMFSSQFLDIGFINRLFLVIANSRRRYAIPPLMPEVETEALRQSLREILKFVKGVAANGRYRMPIDPEAKLLFESWYLNMEQSAFSKRLDTYGHRLMPLLAVNEMQDHITADIAEKTIALLNYQLAARKYADPIDADNAIAKLEERIRRLLANGPMRKRDLERHGKKSRAGTWVWNMAVKNLTTGEELLFDSSAKEYRLRS